MPTLAMKTYCLRSRSDSSSRNGSRQSPTWKRSSPRMKLSRVFTWSVLASL